MLLAFLQYWLGRNIIAESWHRLPIIRNLKSQPVKGSPVEQTACDLIHCISMTIQYFYGYNIRESITAYIITDICFFPYVFLNVTSYLIHHILTIFISIMSYYVGIENEIANFVVFYFEIGLLPIALIDILNAYNARVPFVLYVIRPLVYAASRSYVVWHIHNHKYFIFLLPILIHNAKVCMLQMRSLWRLSLRTLKTRIMQRCIQATITKYQ